MLPEEGSVVSRVTVYEDQQEIRRKREMAAAARPYTEAPRIIDMMRAAAEPAPYTLAPEVYGPPAPVPAPYTPAPYRPPQPPVNLKEILMGDVAAQQGAGDVERRPYYSPEPDTSASVFQPVGRALNWYQNAIVEPIGGAIIGGAKQSARFGPGLGGAGGLATPEEPPKSLTELREEYHDSPMALQILASIAGDPLTWIGPGGFIKTGMQARLVKMLEEARVMERAQEGARAVRAAIPYAREALVAGERGSLGKLPEEAGRLRMDLRPGQEGLVAEKTLTGGPAEQQAALFEGTRPEQIDALATERARAAERAAAELPAPAAGETRDYYRLREQHVAKGAPPAPEELAGAHLFEDEAALEQARSFESGLGYEVPEAFPGMHHTQYEYVRRLRQSVQRAMEEQDYWAYVEGNAALKAEEGKGALARLPEGPPTMSATDVRTLDAPQLQARSVALNAERDALTNLWQENTLAENFHIRRSITGGKVSRSIWQQEISANMYSRLETVGQKGLSKSKDGRYWVRIEGHGSVDDIQGLDEIGSSVFKDAWGGETYNEDNFWKLYDESIATRKALKENFDQLAITQRHLSRLTGEPLLAEFATTPRAKVIGGAKKATAREKKLAELKAQRPGAAAPEAVPIEDVGRVTARTGLTEPELAEMHRLAAQGRPVGAEVPPTPPTPPPAAPPPPPPTVPPSQDPVFAVLTGQMTTEQEQAFNYATASANREARARHFGAGYMRIQEAAAEGATMQQKVRGVVERALTPINYIRNANVLKHPLLSTETLAMGRRAEIGSLDAEMTAGALRNMGEKAGVLKSQDEWAALYRGPAAKTPEQERLIGFIDDVVERHKLYEMTPEQHRFFEEVQKFNDARIASAKTRGLKIGEVEEAYTHHRYAERPRAAVAQGIGARQPGAKERIYESYWVAADTEIGRLETAAARWQKQADALRAEAAGMKSKAKANAKIARAEVLEGKVARLDKRIDKLAKYGGETPGMTPQLLPEDRATPQANIFQLGRQVEQAQLNKALAEQPFIRKIMAMGKVGRTPPRGWRFTTVSQLQGRAFPDDIAKLIEDTLTPEGLGPLGKALMVVPDAAKALMASLDGSPVVGIQGVRRLAENPALGLRDIGKGAQLAFSDAAYRDHLVANLATYRDAAADGVNLFRHFRVTTEAAQKSALAYIPKLGKYLDFLDERMFGRSTAYYKAMSYNENKAILEAALTDDNLLAGLRKPIQSQLLAGKTPGGIAAQLSNNWYGGLEQALRGQARWYQGVERIFLFAPDWLRSNVGMIGTAATKPLTPAGARSLLYELQMLALAGAAAEAGTRAFTGQGANLTDPGRSDWLMLKTGKGSINLAGSLRSYWQGIVGMGAAVKTRDLTEILGEAEWQAKIRAGPASSMVMSQTRNRDVFGRPLTTGRPFTATNIMQRAGNIGKQFLPFSAQQGIEALQTGGGQALLLLGIGLLGFSAYPVRVRTALDIASQKKYGFLWRELSSGQKQELKDTDPGVQRAIAESDEETRRAAAAGDATALLRMAENQAGATFQSRMEAAESLPSTQDWYDAMKLARQDRIASIENLRQIDTPLVKDFFAVIDDPKRITSIKDPDQRRRVQLLSDYVRIFKDNKDATGRLTDEGQTALDAFESSMTTQEAANLMADLGAKDTPRMAQYRKDSATFAPYWDIDDQVWAAFQKAMPDLQQFATEKDMEEHYIVLLSKSQGLPRELIIEYGLLEQIPVISTYRAARNDSRNYLIQKRPIIGEIGLEYGWISGLREATLPAVTQQMVAPTQQAAAPARAATPVAMATTGRGGPESYGAVKR